MNYVPKPYPHCSMSTPLGEVYFDHGHYADGSESRAKRFFKSVYNLIFVPLFGAKKIKEDASFEEIASDKEANLSAVYSAIYYLKVDDFVRATRNFIYRLSGSRVLRMIFVSILVMISIAANHLSLRCPWV